MGKQHLNNVKVSRKWQTWFYLWIKLQASECLERKTKHRSFIKPIEPDWQHRITSSKHDWWRHWTASGMWHDNRRDLIHTVDVCRWTRASGSPPSFGKKYNIVFKVIIFYRGENKSQLPLTHQVWWYKHIFQNSVTPRADVYVFPKERKKKKKRHRLQNQNK